MHPSSPQQIMASTSAAMPDILQPTWFGFILTTRDVCLLLEMVLSGRLPHVPRRPHERERPEVIQSGNIFIYEESVSGVKRWTDGVNWSPSRILGNFLLYREMEAGYPGEGSKKVALKKNRAPAGSKPTGIRKRSPPSATPASLYTSYGTSNDARALPCNYGPEENELCHLEDRQLIGSLTDSYPFVPDGLVKKTITLSIDGVPHHVVSYYKPAHVRSGTLKTPTMEPSFSGITPRDNLLRSNAFRVPVEQEEFRINENSEAYITHAQAQAQVQGLYQQHQPQQQQQHHVYQPRALSMPNQHGLPDHGLSMAGMQNFGQHPFHLQAHPSALQGVTPFPVHTPAPLTGSLQGMAQNGMEAIGSGHYQQPGQQATPHGFSAAETEVYDFHGGSSRQSTYVPTQNNAYMPTQTNAYASVQNSAYAPTPDAQYTPTQNNGYVPSPASGYPGTREYRQSSVTAAQTGYMQLLPGSSPPDPSPSGLQGDTKSEPTNWPADYANNTQGQFMHDPSSQWQ
jgi:hypothetical protein